MVDLRRAGQIKKIAATLVMACLLLTQASPARLDIKAETASSDFRGNNLRQIEYLNSLPTGTEACAAKLEDISAGIAYYSGADGFAEFERDETALYTVDIPEAGYYNIEAAFHAGGGELTYIDIAVEVNGELQFSGAENVRMFTEWTDGGEILTDRYGNETVPSQEIIDKEYHVKLKDHNGDNAYPYVFYFEQGKNEIKITNNRTFFFIGAITVMPVKRIIGYDEYIGQYQNEKVIGAFVEKYEAEQTVSKNKASILPESERDPSITPYDSRYLKLNFIGGSNFYEAGESVNWEIDAPETGLYRLTFKTKQFFSVAAYMPAFRSISIDGEIPFAELSCYNFTYSGSWRNSTLSDDNGDPYLFYFTKGKHTVSFVIDNTPFSEVIVSLKQTLEEINDLSLSIRKMTGNVTDVNREWDLSEYLPEAAGKLEEWTELLRSHYNYLLGLSHSRAKYVTFIKNALQIIENLAAEPNELPNRLSSLSTGASSVYAQISNIISYIEVQPLSIDAIYVHGDVELPMPETSFMTKFMEGVKRFFYTFGAQEYTVKRDVDEVTAWIGKNRNYAALLQQMIDTDFTPKTGIKVSLSIMPDENKMILGNASGTNPDMVIGASTNYPYELAIRGAATDLSKMDGFFKAAQTVRPGAFVSYMMDGGVYAMPETQDFWVLFYRKDVLAKLNLEVPETWDDVVAMLPTLQRYGMNFASNIAFFEAMKPLQATMPFIYQYDGTVVSDDGFTTAIDGENALKGIKFMTDLFNIYSTPQRVNNLYLSMQRSDIPIGIGNFGTYLNLSFAADDMTGKWDIAPLPGIRQENGEINRQAPGAAQCSLIFANSDQKEGAWELMKWYLSTETQSRYGDMLYMTFGEGYLLNTANVKAFEHMQMPEGHKKTILTQWESLVELPRVPGYYMIERELSNVWNKVVIDGAPLRETVDDSVILINREIWRKMEEFKYVVDGETVKSYDVPTVEKITKWLQEGLRQERGE